MKPLFVGWQTQGNADNVCVIIEVPYLKTDYHPDDLINQKILVVYGRRNGKLRCKVESWLGNIEVHRTQFLELGGKYLQSCSLDQYLPSEGLRFHQAEDLIGYQRRVVQSHMCSSAPLCKLVLGLSSGSPLIFCSPLVAFHSCLMDSLEEGSSERHR